MKKYTFRLEPVLKMRKLREENCRTELGVLMNELRRIEEQLERDSSEIDRYYQIQEGGLLSGLKATQLQAFPMLVAGKARNIELLHMEKERQHKKIESKRQELASLKGELKVMENLKEKDYDEYRKSVAKDINQKVEEQTQLWLLQKEKA
jgi:flagellar FliJ protein